MAGLITGSSTLTVRARQQLGQVEVCETFCDKLQEKLMTEDGSGVVFEDFDISQNKLPVEQFQSIFDMLSLNQAHVQRLRAFGCATLNDTALGFINNWLSQCTEQNAPYEMHLSDCAITTEGFNGLMEAIQFSDAFPPIVPRTGKKAPVYMRLENNFIMEEAIQEKIDSGLVVAFEKRNDNPANYGEAKVKLLVRTPGKYQQKEGDPPDPDDAPAPRPVNDLASSSYGKGQQQAKGNGKSSFGGKSWGGAPTQVATWAPKPFTAPSMGKGVGGKGKSVQPAQTWQGKGAFSGKGAQKGGVAQPQMQKGGWQQPAATQTGKGKGKGKGQDVGARGSVGSAAQRSDRSRTPAPPAGKPPANLPPPWEEHWSDEYGIPYFWNSKTGDAVWERPTK